MHARDGRWAVSGLLLAVVCLGPGVVPATAATVEWGDNGSEWANDGQCDDPRFAGPGMAFPLVDADRFHDADDCRALYGAGLIYLREDDRDAGDPPGRLAIDFGDDTSEWASDGECDDPRFAGPGMAASLVAEDIRRDASDCEVLYREGRVRLRSPAR